MSFCDPDTRETDLGFSQLVAIDWLVRYELCNLELSIEAGRPVQVENRTGGIPDSVESNTSCTTLIVDLGGWRKTKMSQRKFK